MAEPDIRVRVGVEGGASIDQGSGAHIRKELQKIAASISSQKKVKISVFLNNGVAKRLQQDLDAIAKNLTLNVATVDVSGATVIGAPAGSSSGGAGNNGNAGQSGGQPNHATRNLKYAETQLTRINQLMNKIKGENFNLSFDYLIDGNQKATSDLNAIMTLMDDLDRRLKRIKGDQNQLAQGTETGISKDISLLGILIQKYNEAYVKTERFNTKQNAAVSSTPKSISAASAELAKFNQYLQAINPKGLKEFASQIDIIRKLLADGIPGSTSQAKIAIEQLKAEMKSAGYEGGNLFTFVGQKIKTFGTYLASSKLMNTFIQGLAKVKENVITLDGALTDLRIVTGNTKTETEALLKTYNQMAQQLGTTTANVAAGATDWLRQGYSEVDSAELLKQSMTLSIVGAMESADATNALTAAMKGYQLSVDEASSVVDKFFTVDMKAATSSADLATALSKTAANAKLAGLSLDDVIGQLAVVNETMKESGEETGTFYNTMLSRMGAIKSGRLEDPETGESLSDVEATLSGMGIALRDASGQFRNFGDVIDEVGLKWGEYSNTQQRALASAFAGTRQQTRFLSLMAGYEQAAEYANAAADSTGAAAEKLGIYQESLEAKANKMAAAFEGLSTAWLPSELIGLLYDAGTAILNFGASLGGIPSTIATTTTAIMGLKTALDFLQGTKLGASIANTAKDLGWPEMTGDIIVPIRIKKAA